MPIWSVGGLSEMSPGYPRFEAEQMHFCYAHRSHEQAPIAALAALCELWDGHPDWMRWYSAVVPHSEYLKRAAHFTEPWGMLPASVYSLDESKDPRFQEQVRNGVPLSEKFFLRRFPVWFDLEPVRAASSQLGC